MAESTVIIVFGFLAILLSGLTYGTTGFGFGLVSVPLLLIFLPPQMAVPASLLLSSVTGISIVLEARRNVELKRIWPLMVGGFLGIPVGTFVLTVLDPNLLKVIIGVIISLCAVAFLTGFRKPVRSETITSIPIGFASGLLNGATGMSGPPVILFFSNQGVKKNVFRANLATHFLILNIITLPMQGVSGLLTREVFTYVLWWFPAMVIGTWAGIKLSHKINENLFRTMALALVAATGLVSVATGIRAF